MRLYLQPYKKYAQFSGRASRKEYWTYYLFQLLVMVGLFGLMMAGGLAGAMGARDAGMGAASIGISVIIGAILLALFSLGSMIPTLAVGVRRLHDRDLSGWWMLCCFIPYIGGLIFFVLLVLPGTAGPNRFGDDPKAIGE
jgi:uncharacterized membrane protein YhaH (DUF805 family)